MPAKSLMHLPSQPPQFFPRDLAIFVLVEPSKLPLGGPGRQIVAIGSATICEQRQRTAGSIPTYPSIMARYSSSLPSGSVFKSVHEYLPLLVFIFIQCERRREAGYREQLGPLLDHSAVTVQPVSPPPSPLRSE